MITLNVNGESRNLDIPDDMPLLWTLRDVLSMTGTKFGWMESGIVFGLSAALDGEITVKAGRVEQTNFGDYRVLRINEMPRIDVQLVKSLEGPGGIGEPGTSCVMPALANAIYAASGKRIRKLPVGNQTRTA